MKRIYKKGMHNVIVIFLLIASISSYGQTRQEKTVAIINKMNLTETQKAKYKFQLEKIKYQAIGSDSIKIIELEKELSEEEIIKRLTAALNNVFSDREINDIYEFIQTSAFEKFFNAKETYKVISVQFSDIDREIEEITNNFSQTIEKPTKKFKPIPVDKKDGFYETLNYAQSIEDKDIKLKENPSLDSKDILEVKKVYSNYNDKRPEISIVLTKDGARKLFLLTKENIGKPIAIVVEKQIVSMPIVQSQIMGGKVTISGDFSEKEIDGMIEKLKGE